MEFKVLYTDHAPHSSLGTVLKWCDTAQGALFRSIPDKTVAEELMKAYSLASVMRTNTVEMLMNQHDWVQHMDDAAVAVVRPLLVRIGRTSWVIQSSVETSAAVPIARVQTVMVAVDPNDSTKPVPVPHAETLRGIMREAAPVEAPQSGVRPPNSFVWRTEVRQSDCDDMQHINNAFYASLFEELRRMLGVPPQPRVPSLVDVSAPLRQQDLPGGRGSSIWASRRLGTSLRSPFGGTRRYPQ